MGWKMSMRMAEGEEKRNRMRNDEGRVGGKE